MPNFIQVKGHTFVEGEPVFVTGFVLHVYLGNRDTPAALNMVDLLTEDGEIVYRAFVLQVDLLGVATHDLLNGSEDFLLRLAMRFGGAGETFILANLIYREKEAARVRAANLRLIRAESRRNGARLLANR